MAIQYVIGDATRPLGCDPRVLVHVCNDVGKWGKGFVLAISRRWKLPEQQFKAWYRGETGQSFALGEVQFVEVERALWVANIVGQRALASKQGDEPPIRYAAVRVGLAKVRTHALAERASVHMPRIGCGLAGGRWEEIESIINSELSAHGVAVTVYDLADAG
jgi:O-acetyl-ADP-ribose deacetylase (regulator of RNase III)